MAQTLSMLLTAWQMVAKRSLAHWRLLSSVIIGVFLASTVLAGTVIYFEALRDLALKSALDRFSETDLDILVHASRTPTSSEEYTKVSKLVSGGLDSRLAWLQKDRIRGGKTVTFFLASPGGEELAEDSDERGYFVFLPRLQQHVSLLPGGRLPQEQSLNAPGDPLELEALIADETAEAFGVGVGDRLSTVQFWFGATQYVTVTISGVFRKLDPTDEFWYLDDGAFRASASGDFSTAPFYISENTFLEVLGPQFPRMGSTYAWLLVVDKERLEAENTSAARAHIALLEEQLRAEFPLFRQITLLDDALADYDRRLLFTRLQMFVVLILIAVVILYYVATLSSLLVEQQSGEIALLRSRGASPTQILTVYVLQGLTISTIAVVAAPLIAGVAVSLLGFTSIFSDLTGNARMPVNISTSAYMMSTLGGVLSFGALLIPAVQASKIGITAHRQLSSRPPALPAFQRYYLDVLLLVVSIVLFRQLSQQGSVAARNALGDVVVNQVLLAVPALLLVASAMVLLRVFPLALNIASRLMSPRLPPGIVMGLWQMSRNPTHYARLSLLLILMSGLGIFAASFGGTLERSFKERVLYSVGSDIRLERVRLNNTGVTRPFVASYQQLPGVDVVSPVFRGGGRDLTKRSGESFEMLAIDPDTFTDVTWFRDDFASRPLEDLLKPIQSIGPSEGIRLPENARAISVLVKSNRLHPSVALSARIRDANDRYFTYVLGALESSGWVSMESNLSRPSGASGTVRPLSPVRPLTLVSVAVHETRTTSRLQPGSILIDEIRARRSTGEVVVIEAFDDTTGWSILGSARESISDSIEESDVAVGGESRSVARFTWSIGSPLVSRGIFPGKALSPIPVIASDSFTKDTGHSVGDTIDVSVAGHRMQVRLVDTIKFLPTLDTISDKFLVADIAALTGNANPGALFNELAPNEVWLTTHGGSDRQELIARLAKDEPFTVGTVHDRDASLAGFLVDPLVGAGWKALLFIAFGAILILSAVGFVVHAYVSFQNRQLQFALLRTMGFSTKQLIALMCLEQTLVTIVGMALGTWMGGRLGATIMPFLGHDESGGAVLPPFVVEINWATLSITYVVMLLVFALIIAGVIWLIRKMSLQNILRLGEG